MLPASVCPDGNINLGWGEGGSSPYTPHHQPPVCPLCFYTCVSLTPFPSIISIIMLSIPDPPPPLSFCLFLHVFLLLHDCTSQFLPSETSPLLSNEKSISQFAKVALVLAHSLFSFTHSYSYTQTNTKRNLSEELPTPFHPVLLKDNALRNDWTLCSGAAMHSTTNWHQGQEDTEEKWAAQTSICQQKVKTITF